MPSVLTGAHLGQFLAAACGQSEHVVQFAIGEQSAIGGDHGTAKLEQQTAIKIEPQRLAFWFTRPPSPLRQTYDKILNLISELAIRRSEFAISSGECGL